jgi:hypothetical protein
VGGPEADDVYQRDFKKSDSRKTAPYIVGSGSSTVASFARPYQSFPPTLAVLRTAGNPKNNGRGEFSLSGMTVFPC